MDSGIKTSAESVALIESFSGSDLTGLCTGTEVMTLDGAIPVEHLAPEDRVITRDVGMARLRDIRVTEARVALVSIKAGSLGHTRPERDMVICPGTRIHIRDWRARAMFGADTATVPARRLIDGEFVKEMAVAKVKVYDLIFDTPHIVYADGLEIAAPGR